MSAAVAVDRKAQLVRLVHVAKRELRLDDESYRTILRTASGGRTASSADMKVQELERAMDQFRRSGFKTRATKSATHRPGSHSGAAAGTPGQSPTTQGRHLDTRDEARKVRALWLFLHALGAVRDPSERALAAYCKRIAKVDDLHWASGGAMETLIETLKKWAMRDALPTAIRALRDDLTAKHRAEPLSAAQIKLFTHARELIARNNGFDAYWLAYECLCEALGRPIPGDADAIGAKK